MTTAAAATATTTAQQILNAAGHANENLNCWQMSYLFVRFQAVGYSLRRESYEDHNTGIKVLGDWCPLTIKDPPKLSHHPRNKAKLYLSTPPMVYHPPLTHHHHHYHHQHHLPSTMHSFKTIKSWRDWAEERPLAQR
mmetsp:Transcript_138910/g.241544  ORF Transcript_138910/g.241544 Transcript_138910/m.241544 type:complete len:137 (+) Transcript_138910:399-809(+)